MLAQRNQQRVAKARSAFTLIELLMVIAIIGVLVALTLRVVGGLISTARRAATQTVITKVHTLLKSRTQAVERLANSRANPGRSGNVMPGLGVTPVDYVGNSGRNREAAVITKKALARFYLPQTWDEAFDSSLHVEAGVATLPSYPATKPGSFPWTAPAGRLNLETEEQWEKGRLAESAEVLYFVLTKSSIPGYDSPGADAFSTTDVVDSNNNGFPEFTDGWQQPLRFYRWPTGLVKPSGDNGDDADHSEINTSLAGLIFRNLPTSPAQLNADFDDPTALLNVLTDMGSPPFTRTDFENNFHTIATFSLPVVMSVGADGILGLGEPNATSPARLARPLSGDHTTIADNISNHNIIAGGQ
jgi:prepilin-type N-terminal cleavage/methylation domain-containing protein